jgi:SAM-dependent methyltransferase
MHTVIPRKLLWEYEDFMRGIYARSYYGHGYQCTICHTDLKRYIHLHGGDLLCPRCGSLGRHRRLVLELSTYIDAKPGYVFDFSPARCIYRYCKGKLGDAYHASDLSEDFIAELSLDICNMQLADQTADLVICYHVLEHIVDDTKAMSELYRITRPGGTVFIQTPYTDTLYEDYSIVKPEDRLKQFGQSDHVRIYDRQTLLDRLMAVGFDVEMKSYSERLDNPYGLKVEETIFICKK